MSIALALTFWSVAWALAQAPDVSFLAVDVVVDTQSRPLAAYQIEIHDPTGHAQVVGVEGGDPPAFHEPPYYDPRALRSGRIVLAALHEGEVLPTGKTRVAVLHVELVGSTEPQLEARILVAASPEAKVIPATVVLIPGGAS